MLTEIITSEDQSLRDRSLADACAGLDRQQLLAEAEKLDLFRRESVNLYHRVRALFFLHAIHRYLLLNLPGGTDGSLSFVGYKHLLARRFSEAIDAFLADQAAQGSGDAISSALATSYHHLAFQTLADQVRKSVRTVRGNQWMFRMGHPAEHPLRIRPELLADDSGTYPILLERTPVRMDLTHSAWSDIFFLGMDFPQGAKVINVSIDLALHGSEKTPAPPVSAYLRVIDRPVIRLTSIDLKASAEIHALADVFDFAKDHLGLLKAAIISSGLIPPGIEGSGMPLGEILSMLLGPGKGLELVSSVNHIPKGSRLAVSTNLLAALISVCMRATGQATSLTGELAENERRLVLARAILGEWIGGSGGGWQDSGGVWPGIKLIQGTFANEGDPEFGISRGRLMPQHHVFSADEIPAHAREALQNSLVLVHGGMAQNVGPILEMVTEKYLTRATAEWKGRQEALNLLEKILGALKNADIRTLGQLTTQNFRGPLQAIIPWATNLYTETLIARAQAEFGDDFWGFWMLGGMSGGGMGFIFEPSRKTEAQARMLAIMTETKAVLRNALPFAMEPVVYDFSINPHGTFATLHTQQDATLPADYYQLHLAPLLRTPADILSPAQRAELAHFSSLTKNHPDFRNALSDLLGTLFPASSATSQQSSKLAELLDKWGFDSEQHESIRRDLLANRIGLSKNRLPAITEITDVQPGDFTDLTKQAPAASSIEKGRAALAAGSVAVLTLAAGAGSRWTQGAGVCKALNPYAKFGGRHRTFIETHLAKSHKRGTEAGSAIPHIFTTSYLTDAPTRDFLAHYNNYDYPGSLYLSAGKSVGLRMIPTERDLRFAWEEMPQQALDEQQQKMRDSVRSALINWARSTGEASDYTANLPLQCLHPIGHFYELPNLLLNGTFAQLLRDHPNLKTIMLHNIDTLGADVDPAILGHHLDTGCALTFEVITRRLEDRGGGLARVDGRPRLLEGLAMPREEDEFHLSYYNTMTTWIDVDQFLKLLKLDRATILAEDSVKIAAAVRALASRLPTYLTLKDVKKRWGNGQEDIFPVTQFEKLWSDLSLLSDVNCSYVVVDRMRGQQLKEPSQLDAWYRDGSANHIAHLCGWTK